MPDCDVCEVRDGRGEGERWGDAERAGETGRCMVLEGDGDTDLGGSLPSVEGRGDMELGLDSVPADDWEELEAGRAGCAAARRSVAKSTSGEGEAVRDRVRTPAFGGEVESALEEPEEANSGRGAGSLSAADQSRRSRHSCRSIFLARSVRSAFRFSSNAVVRPVCESTARLRPTSCASSATRRSSAAFSLTATSASRLSARDAVRETTPSIWLTSCVFSAAARARYSSAATRRPTLIFVAMTSTFVSPFASNRARSTMRRESSL